MSQYPAANRNGVRTRSLLLSKIYSKFVITKTLQKTNITFFTLKRGKDMSVVV